MEKPKSRLRIHLPYLIAILILIGIVFSPFIFNINEFVWSDKVGAYYPIYETIKESLTEYHDLLPLWTPYVMSGTVFYAEPSVGFFYLPIILAWFLSTAVMVKTVFIFNIVFAAFAMYALVIYLKQKPKFAFLAAIIYIFNGWYLTHFKWGHLTTLSAYAFTPLIILFAMKAVREKAWFKNALITGILFALSIHAGSDLKVTLWVALIFGIYLAFSLIGKEFKKKLVKAVLIGATVGLVTFGLVAIKVLPSKEYISLSSREHVSFEESASRKIAVGDLFTRMVEPIYEGMPKIRRDSINYHIGIIAFLLAGFALWKNYKKKNVLFFTTVVILSAFLVTGSFVFYLLWRYVPPYDSFRYLPRILNIYVFAMSILAATGAALLVSKIQKKFTLTEKKVNIVYLTIVGLILLNLVVFNVTPFRTGTDWRNIKEMEKGNPILQHLADQEGLFRVHVSETKGIDWGTEYTFIAAGIENIYGHRGSWLVEYMNVYLGLANQQPAKWHGNLNVKYVTSQNPLNVSGLKFIHKFEPCEICYPRLEPVQKIWGPYLYENELFMPRAYLIDKAVLVIGEKESAKQLMYAIMMSNEYSPQHAVIVLGKENIGKYTMEELKQYDVLILAQGSVDQSSVGVLNTYTAQGGILVPDVIKGENQLTNDMLSNTLTNLQGSFTPIDDNSIEIIDYDNKEITINKAYDGFLVYSETFPLYPGWKATLDGKEKEILRANGVIAAIPLKGERNIAFSYMPRSFVIGATITVITLLFLLSYGGYAFFKKRKQGTRITRDSP